MKDFQLSPTWHHEQRVPSTVHRIHQALLSVFVSLRSTSTVTTPPATPKKDLNPGRRWISDSSSNAPNTPLQRHLLGPSRASDTSLAALPSPTCRTTTALETGISFQTSCRLSSCCLLRRRELLRMGWVYGVVDRSIDGLCEMRGSLA